MIINGSDYYHPGFHMDYSYSIGGQPFARCRAVTRWSFCDSGCSVLRKVCQPLRVSHKGLSENGVYPENCRFQMENG